MFEEIPQIGKMVCTLNIRNSVSGEQCLIICLFTTYTVNCIYTEYKVIAVDCGMDGLMLGSRK